MAVRLGAGATGARGGHSVHHTATVIGGGTATVGVAGSVSIHVSGSVISTVAGAVGGNGTVTTGAVTVARIVAVTCSVTVTSAISTPNGVTVTITAANIAISSSVVSSAPEAVVIKILSRRVSPFYGPVVGLRLLLVRWVPS